MYCNLNKAIPVIEEMVSRPGGATIKEIKDVLKIKRTKVMLRILKRRMDLDLLAMFKMTAEEIKDDMPLENGKKESPGRKAGACLSLRFGTEIFQSQTAAGSRAFGRAAPVFIRAGRYDRSDTAGIAGFAVAAVGRREDL